MRMAIGWGLVFALLTSGAVRADGDGLTEAQQAAWQDVLKRVGTLSGAAIEAPVLRELAPKLEGIPPAVLRRMARYRNLEQLNEEGYVYRAQHALRTAAHLFELRDHLDEPLEICRQLGGRTEGWWMRGLIEILRLPFDERLGRVAQALLRDERGVVRAGAGLIARYLNGFCGGRGSDWGAVYRTDWDPTPVVRSMAQHLLDDRNPAVAVKFAGDAYALEDKAVIDMMVERIHDQRQMPRVPFGRFLGRPEKTVGEAIRSELSAHFHFYRKDDPMRMPEMRPTPAPRRVTSLPASREPAAIATWWKSVRSQWSFRPDGAKWHTVIDDAFFLEMKKPVRVKTTFGPVIVELVDYGEHWDGTDPDFTIQVDARSEDEDAYVHVQMGNPRHHLGYVSGGTWGSGGVETWAKILHAPRRADGRVPARIRIWTCDQPKPPK